MSKAFNQCSLYLRPARHDFTLDDLELFTAELRNIQLISKTIDKQSNSYYTGDNYLDYIAYMGCAPNIKFKADPNSKNNNENFCQITLHQYKSPHLIVSQKQASAPLCPNCKNPIRDWQENKTSTTIQCPLCSNTTNINDLNWRKMAGCAQLFIEISDIFPKEALPQQSLLDKLKDITNTDWLYFYSCR